jgi:dipeptidyl aminopeptidase/acylaminoacyl peptidase
LEMALRCGDIFRFAQIAEAVVSPGGDAVALVKRTAKPASDRYEFELQVAPVPGVPWSGISGFIADGLRYVAWAPDGRELAAAEQAAGESEAAVVIVSALDGTRRRLVTGVSRPAAITWSPDGTEVAFLAVTRSGLLDSAGGAAVPVLIANLSAKIDGLGATGGWQRHLFAADTGTGIVRQLTSGDQWVEDFCYSSSGVIAYCSSEPYAGSVPRQPGAIRPCAVRVLSRQGGQARALTTPEASAKCPVFASDGSLVYVGLPGLRAEQPGLFAVPAEGGAPRRLAAGLDRGVVTSSSTFQGGHRPVAIADDKILFCARDGGCVQLYEASLREPASVRKVAGSATESIGAVSLSRSGKILGYVSSTTDGCQRLTIVNLVTGSEDVVASSVPAGQVLQPEPVQFTARDGVKLQGWLIRGRADGPNPLLVDVHGGSFSGAWSPLVQPCRLYQQELASRGWTTLLLNARGSDGYGSEFARSAVGAWGLADSRDFHDAIDELVKRGLADPARLAVTGYSYGGFMTNWLTATSDRFAAAVSGGSICDFVSLFGTSDMGWVMSEFDIRVRPHLDPEDALRRSPVGLGGRVRTPTLLLHGEADMRCPISQAEEWLAILLSSGCEAALVRYPDASHGFLTSGPPSFAADYGDRLVQWVTSHVTGDFSAPAA